MMKRLVVFLLTLMPFQVCFAKLHVMTSTTDLASIARSIGGDLLEIQSLAKGRQDPHFIEAKPSFMLDAHKADLYIAVGLDLEIGYLPLILEGARNPNILTNARGYLDVSSRIEKLELPGVDVDRSMGDVHPLGNPHYWLDPYNGRLIAEDIEARLAELDPPNTATYQKNLQSFLDSIDKGMFGADLVAQLGSGPLWEHKHKGDLEAWLQSQGKAEALAGWEGRMSPRRGAKIVTFHRSFPYFAHAFDLDIIDQLEPKPGIPPSPSHLVEVIRKMLDQKVHAILQEPYYDSKPSNLVAEKTGATVVMVANSVGGDEGVDDYVQLIDHIVKRVADALDQKES
jgi:zinc/manganese transport system substrate-binding protein